MGEPFRLKPIRIRRDRIRRKAGSGRRALTKTLERQGRGVGARMAEEIRDLALDATLRAAAPHQPSRRKILPDGPAVRIRPCDLRERTREKRMVATTARNSPALSRASTADRSSLERDP